MRFRNFALGGTLRTAEICAEFESVGVSKDLTPARELLERLEAEFERIRPALIAELLGEIQEKHM